MDKLLVGGETACRRGELSEILVGKCRHAFRDFDAAATGNALGLGFLSRHRVVFDFPNSAVYLAPGSRFDQSFSENRSGIHVYKSKRGLFVGYVTPRSPGYAAGVRPGHRIVKIDGQPTGGMSLYTARRKLCDPRDGTRLETDPPIGAGTVALHNARRADAALPEDGVRGRK